MAGPHKTTSMTKVREKKESDHLWPYRQWKGIWIYTLSKRTLKGIQAGNGTI